MEILEQLAEDVRYGRAAKTAELVQKGLDEGLNWETILNKGLFRGMEVIGALFRDEEVFIPEVLMSAKAMQTGVNILEPLMTRDGTTQTRGKIVLGTVKGDLHNLGKNLVGIMLGGAGFEVVDLGVDVSPEKFVEAVAREKPQLVGMSALLTSTMPQMRTTIRALQAAGLKEQVKVMVGGACVTRQYAAEIGADGFAENAASAVDQAKSLAGLK